MQNKTAFATILILTTAMFSATLAMTVQSAVADTCSSRSGACVKNGGVADTGGRASEAFLTPSNTIAYAHHYATGNPNGNGAASHGACGGNPTAVNHGQKVCAG